MNFNQNEVKQYQADQQAGLTREQIAAKHNVSSGRVKKGLSTLTLKRVGLVPVSEGENKVIGLGDLQQTINQSLLKGFTADIFKPADLRFKNYAKNKVVETANLQITDAHVGSINSVTNLRTNKLEETYNVQIFLQELQNLRKAIGKINELLKYTYFFEQLNIYLTGDLPDNDRIYKGQKLHVEKNIGEQIWECVGALGQFFITLKPLYPKINIYLVPGNHGRTTEGRTAEPATSSFEWLLGKMLELLFKNDDKISVVTSDDFVYMVTIYKWKYLLTHGDNIRGWGGLPFYGIARAALQYLASVYPEMRLDLIVGGHIHQYLDLPIAEHLDWVTSTAWAPRDNYSFTNFRTYPRTVQRFWGCNPKYRMTWSFPLDLQTGGFIHATK